MIIRVKAKHGKKNVYCIRAVRGITIEAVDGITYAKLHHAVGPETYIPADEFYLLDDKNHIIEIVGH